MKRKWPAALGVGALIVIVLFGLWYWAISGLFRDMADTPYKYKEDYPSPSGTYSITVWRSDAVWSFGSADAKIAAASGGEGKEYETQIRDDGGRGSVDVRWLDDDTAQVTLQGQEQRDEIVTVDFSGGIRIMTSDSVTAPPDAASAPPEVPGKN